MRNFTVIFLVALTTIFSSFSALAKCDPKTTLGVSRTIEVNTNGGALLGVVQYKQTLDLKPGEIVLTFDDGPHPRNTLSILRTLESHCTKATFFAVGEMVRTYPGVIKKVADAGHTIAAHTHTHPNLRAVSFKKAKYEIERGFAEVIQATGKPIAPFFRFPGLAHSDRLNKYLASRNIATLSVDVITNDTYHRSPSKILRNTLSQLKKRKKGMILMHDLKSVTARTLPSLLRELKRNKYKVVHIVPEKKIAKANYNPKPLSKYALNRKYNNNSKALPHQKKKIAKTFRPKKYTPKKYRYERKKTRTNPRLAATAKKKKLAHNRKNRTGNRLHGNRAKPKVTKTSGKKPVKLCLLLLFGCIE